MTIAPFSYHDPTSVHGALKLRETLEDAKPLAGGQSLVPFFVFRMQRHRHLIDLNNIPELSYCLTEDGFMRIGAMTRHCIAPPTACGRFPITLLDAICRLGSARHFAIGETGTTWS
jgi:aerobic carbon-monoxide dehydrogenase medium subunit